MTNCLLTGASGFLGKYLRHALEREGLLVFSLSRQGSGEQNLKGDLKDPDLDLQGNKFDLIVHAAGMAHRVPKTEAEAQEFLDTNINGTKHLLEAIERTGYIPSQFVFISSVSVYGLEKGVQVAEDQPLAASEPYGRSKIACEELLESWGRQHKVTTAILRLPLIVGAKPPGNLGAMLKGIKSGRYFRIGRGEARKSMVLASNVAAVITRAAQTGGIYNLTDGHHPSFRELEDKVAQQLGSGKVKVLPHRLAAFMAWGGQLAENITGRKMPFNKRIFVKITSELTFSDSRARKALGWKPSRVLDNITELTD